MPASAALPFPFHATSLELEKERAWSPIARISRWRPILHGYRASTERLIRAPRARARGAVDRTDWRQRPAACRRLARPGRPPAAAWSNARPAVRRGRWAHPG